MDPLPTAEEVEHKIKVTSDKIISTLIYKNTIAMQSKTESHIAKFKKHGLIRKSQPLLHLGDSYPLPSIQEILFLGTSQEHVSI